MPASCLPLQILAQLSQFRTLPDFDNYLALILAKGEGQPIEVRSAYVPPHLLRRPPDRRLKTARLA